MKELAGKTIKDEFFEELSGLAKNTIGDEPITVLYPEMTKLEFEKKLEEEFGI